MLNTTKSIITVLLLIVSQSVFASENLKSGDCRIEASSDGSVIETLHHINSLNLCRDTALKWAKNGRLADYHQISFDSIKMKYRSNVGKIRTMEINKESETDRKVDF